MNTKEKQELFQKIDGIGFFDQLVQNDLFLDFINSFKDLKSMKSTDGRPQFKNAEDDIRQHYILNPGDYSLDEVFSSRVGLYQDDKLFTDFLLAVVDSRFTIDKDLTESLVTIINNYLHQDNQEFYLYGYGSNGRPVYRIKNVEEEYSPRGVEANKIPIFIDKLPTGNTKYRQSHKRPSQFPCFVLAFNFLWDDYSVCTRFDLFYYDEQEACTHIGDVKLIHTSFYTKEQFNQGYYKVANYMADNYVQLPADFCSLGQNEGYYFTMRRLFGERMMSVLWALRDCAVFPIIEEKFSNHPNFFSLIREREAENTLNDVMYKLKDENSKTRFFFKYHFKPDYADEPTDIEFLYSSAGNFPNNLYAIIGRNGTGKTQLISHLPLDLEARNENSFNHIPSFKKNITVSYCYYDNFEIPDASASFDYRYCGLLKKMPNGTKQIMTKEDLQARLISDCQEINKKDRVEEWTEVMRTFFDEATIHSWMGKDGKNTLNPEAIVMDVGKLSSGQSSFVYVFCDIMAHIRKYSLILFDEPETHLHPEAITSLINAVQRLLKQYNSYGLIVTHSPIIVRELLSRNVLVMRRNGNTVAVHKIGIESFGENLSVLTNEIFGSEEVQPYFKRNIEDLVSEGADYNYIVSQIQTEGIPLNLNLQMYVKNLIRMKSHEEG